jgi:hypothetical protein
MPFASHAPSGAIAAWPAGRRWPADGGRRGAACGPGRRWPAAAASRGWPRGGGAGAACAGERARGGRQRREGRCRVDVRRRRRIDGEALDKEEKGKVK